MSGIKEGPNETIHAFFRRIHEEANKLFATTLAKRIHGITRLSPSGWPSKAYMLRSMAAPTALYVRDADEMREIYHAIELNMRHETGHMQWKLVGAKPARGDTRDPTSQPKPRANSPTRKVICDPVVRVAEVININQNAAQHLSEDHTKQMIKTGRCHSDTVAEQRNQHLLDRINHLANQIRTNHGNPPAECYPLQTTQE